MDSATLANIASGQFLSYLTAGETRIQAKKPPWQRHTRLNLETVKKQWSNSYIPLLKGSPLFFYPLAASQSRKLALSCVSRKMPPLLAPPLSER